MVDADRQAMRRSEPRNYDEFWDWVDRTRKTLDMSYRAMELKAGVGNATISARAKDKLPPTDTTIKAIANAFDLLYEDVLQHAGEADTVDRLIPDSEFERVYQRLKRMTPAEIATMRGYIDYRYPEVGKNADAAIDAAKGETDD